jgi:tetratricopeptide (TPR) repeat protein
VFAALLLAALSPTAQADTITLRSGKQVEGAIVEETPQQLVVRTRLGTLRLAASEITGVARNGTVPEEVDGDTAHEAKNLAGAAEMYRAALAKVGNNAPARERIEAKLKAVQAEMAAANRSAIEKDIGLLRQAVTEKRYDDAIALAERLWGISLAEDQTSTIARLKAEAHFGKATQMLDRMDYVGADRELEKAVATYDPFYRAHLLLGERLLASAYTQNRGIDELLKGLRYGEKEISEAERVKYHYLVGRALYQRGDYKEAASHFVECVGDKDKFPAYADALDRAADCFVKMGEQTLLKNANEAVNNLKHAIELDPKRAQAWFLLGKLYRDLGQTDNAIDAFRKLIELEPSFPYGHEFLALSLIDAKNYDEALQHLDEEIKQRPANYQAYVDRAEVQIALGNFDKADQDLATVTSKDPSRWEAFMARARLAYVQEEYDKAQENIQQALALKRDAIEAHILMGKVLRAKKDYDGAKQWLLNVVEYLTKVPDLTFKYKTYLAEAQTQLAEIDLQQDSPRQAQTRLEIALDNVPNFAEAHARLGDVKKRLATDVDTAARRSYYREAEKCYKKAIEADPKNPDYYLALGILYHKNLKDTPKAVENYEKYLELGGKDKTTVAKWIEECGGTVRPELLQTSGTAEALTSGSQTEQ